jgi:UDP-N-acetylmuramate--alanine ligase
VRIHLVGVGGAALSALAHVYLARGDEVSGSDAHESAVTRALAAEGARILVGHRAEQLGNPDVVVLSTAIPEDNPEVRAARDRGLRVVSRAVAVKELVRDRRQLAVAGTAGKTTTTTMLAEVMAAADPLVLSGGRLPGGEFNSRPGAGRFAVIEADESDGSFLELTPEVAVVTNVEADHLDRYHDLEAVRRAFELFVAGTSATLVACVDDEGARALLQGASLDTIGYGFEGTPDVLGLDYQSAAGQARLRVESPWGRAQLELAMPGRHNGLNAMAALSVGVLAGRPLDEVVEALARARLPGRRMELVLEAAGARVYDDYGHHPTKVAASLQAARELGGSRVVCIFQPHMYTRLQAFLPRFAEALGGADEVLVLPVYAARDQPIPGVDAEALGAAVRSQRPDLPVTVLTSLDAAAEAGLARLGPGVVLVFMGAGDVNLASLRLREMVAERALGPSA